MSKGTNANTGSASAAYTPPRSKPRTRTRTARSVTVGEVGQSKTSFFVTPVDPADLVSSAPLPDELLQLREEEYLAAQAVENGAPVAPEVEDEMPSAAQIEELLDVIPERESDLLELYFIKGKKQAEIAAIFKVTQAAISYRIGRALHRIRFLLAAPKVTDGDLARDLPEIFPITPAEKRKAKAQGIQLTYSLDVQILMLMRVLTCQSEVAARLNQTQGLVRHRFFAAIETLQKASDHDPKYAPYHLLFSRIGENFNVLREVRLPQWADRGQSVCD